MVRYLLRYCKLSNKFSLFQLKTKSLKMYDIKICKFHPLANYSCKRYQINLQYNLNIKTLQTY